MTAAIVMELLPFYQSSTKKTSMARDSSLCCCWCLLSCLVRHCTFPLLSDNTKSALPQTSESPDLIRVPLINNSDPTCWQSHHIIPISFDAEKSEALGS